MNSRQHGTPTAAELLDAVAEFLENDAEPTTTGQFKFHRRVAANVLHIVGRELQCERCESTAQALRDFGYPDESLLAAAIRRGELDERAEELRTLLQTIVMHRLTIANPRYLGRDS
ncbi:MULTISPECIES: DUF6285 domain-containing protein [unclassified Mycobacterium]|uniref:DUF6285 domain-containing protein n=1 Tax=unclassified Mycobacterium TaxID=2642494 RepID=UPI00073FC2BF|nr:MULTISPECIES: DUF6285 domain-containing protein [unclassified Mycobacterium]KUH87742.1 hypothetical protein AU185_04680 [Mycobacterium sp. GA-0227b]KUH87789.1 hypothetical protein AU186_03665 [Mycobacterium sp. GA-1999]KUH88681.1 hypothetical protein AU187_07015 [Mycobacterium sp. IS-1556]